MIPGHARVHALFEAEGRLREATEAVAKARDEVVAAAKRYAENEPRGLHVLDAVELLWAAESAEAEARARLEALR